MFNKLKHLKDLRSQAKTLQNALADEIVTIEKSGIKLTMNGNMEITSFIIDDNLSKANIEKLTLESVNEAIEKTQKVMAQKMQEMGGLANFGL